MKDLYIIDASGYIYRSYFAIRNMTNSKGESTNALFGFIRSVSKLIQDFDAKHIVAVFDGPNSIKAREAIYADYKAHRPSMPPDLLYQIQWAHTFCDLRGLPSLNIPNVEADDTMASIAIWAKEHGAKVYLCTSDKDMAQLVDDDVFLLDTFKENKILGRAEVKEKFGVFPHQIVDYLSITGDASDNVPGVEGFGAKTAASLLEQFGSLDYILEHIEEIPGKKKQESFSQNKDKALLSRELVTAIKDVDIPKVDTFYELKPFDKTSLKEFYADKNFNSLLKELENQSTPASSSSNEQDSSFAYHLVDDEKSLHDLIELLKTQKEICFDTETTDIHPLKAKLVGIGFGFEPGVAWYVPVNGTLGKKQVLQALKPLFENEKIGFYGHNVKYDLHVLKNEGITLKNISFDTILASYILNSHTRQHSLDTLALEQFGKVKIPISDLIGKGKNAISMEHVPIEKVCSYCCEDVDYTVRLKRVFAGNLIERKLFDLFKKMEIPLIFVLADMERKGLFLDVPFLEKFSKDLEVHIKEVEEKIFKFAGEEINLNSPKQLSELLFNKLGIPAPKKTATGHSTSAEVLEYLSPKYPIAANLLEYRMLEKIRSTYVAALPLEVNPNTHRIHCTFNQSGTATGRLSCQDPNLQNIPVRTEMGLHIREAFKPEKTNWCYLSADYSQIELRLLAHLSEDKALIDAFQSNQDVHALTAAAIFNTPLNEVTKEMRYQAKAVNFGVVYGQGPFGLSQSLGIDMKDAKAFIDMYFKKYNRVLEYIEACKENARKLGKAVTLTGRERLIPEIHSKNMQIRAAAERLAINTPLQGTAADLIKLAMLKIHNKFIEEKKIGYMVLQIHDELIFEIPEFEIISIQPLVKNAMETVFNLKVPLLVDIHVGKNWKEC